MPKVKKRLSARDADQLLADIRREGTLQQYKRTAEENKMLEAWRVAEKARNMQIEYAQLAEAVNRMPVALQRGVLERMHALGGALALARRAYPKNFPRGFDPHTLAAQQIHRATA
tara:strand:- start:138 stop:482 length:345 start_codon:yes stop_codon:yes gene_type:complete